MHSSRPYTFASSAPTASTDNAADAEAVLMALATPLEWRIGRTNAGEITLAADKQVTARKSYSFSMRVPYDLDLPCDEDGIPFEWAVSIWGQHVTDTPLTRDGKVIEDEDDVWGKSWHFPCRTAFEAKAICERLVLTEDCSEVTRLARTRYPIVWESSTSSPPSRLLGNFGPRRIPCSWRTPSEFAQYVVSVKRRWFFPYFTAGYELRVNEANIPIHDLYPTHESPHRYKTPAEAKAACARHRVTGVWQ